MFPLSTLISRQRRTGQKNYFRCPNFHQKELFAFLSLHFDDFLKLIAILRSFIAFLVNLIRIQEKCRPFVISSFCVVLIL